jgi:putative salt-induced outer membrane protein YdiY
MRAMGWTVLAVLWSVASVGADEVTLKNGDKLSGKVVALADGKLTLETPHAGVVKIDWAQVASVKSDAKVAVKLQTKEVIEGTLAVGGEGLLRIQTEGAAQPVEVDVAKVTHFNDPPTQWRGNLTLSYKATDGNTHTQTGIATGEAIRATEDDQFLVRFLLRYGKRSGETQERNGYGLAKYQHTFIAGLYGYASFEALSDKFKDLDLGTVTSAGLGYEILKEKWIDLSTEAGIAYFDNNFEVGKDESHMGARASLRLRLALPFGLEFKDVFTIYPNFEESQDFQIRNEATLGTALSGGWALLGGVITEYDRTPPVGLTRHDDTYFVGLGYAF